MNKPPRKKIEAMAETLYGVFGRFQTLESYEVNYFLSNLPINDLDLLTTASEALEFVNTDFEEMMQRDVDYERVDINIIRQYLENGRGRVLFFPPIIVSIVAIENGKVKNLYDSVEYRLPQGIATAKDVQDEGNPELSIIFDEDKFCIQLALARNNTGYSLEVEGAKFNYYSVGATLRYDKSQIRLIVIDGQHRFEALRRLMQQNAALVGAMELPVCIVFTPEAKTASKSHDESIVRDLREMFVTINTTAKDVSGHFVDLLKDKSLASIAVRSLADHWKTTAQEPWRCRLQQLEWNERQTNKANTVQREHSISTVSIITESLRQYAFGSSSDGLQYSLLNLSEVETELEGSDEAIKAYAIEEDKFDPAQADILKEQIRKRITPALDALFTLPRPYREIRDTFLKAVDWLDTRVKIGSDEAMAYRKNILGQFRQCTKRDEPNICAFQNQFSEKIKRQEDDKIYFLNVFQQALLGVWADVSVCLQRELDVPPIATAQIIVEAFEELVFNPRSRFFERDMPYVGSILYSGRRLNVNQAVKLVWKNLLRSTLLQKNTETAFSKALKKHCPELTDEKLSAITEKIRQDSYDALNAYCKALHKKISDVIGKEWRQRPYDRGLREKLDKLSQDDPDEYQKELRKLADIEYHEAIEKLSNKLDIDSVQLLKVSQSIVSN
jgi:hypothetical protein